MRGLRLTGCCVLALLLAGCSTFDHDWDAAAMSRPGNATDITGRWHGEWVSDASSHSGDLRCLIAQLDKKTYHARYYATYWNIFHFEYEMNLTADRRGEWMHFVGQADLGSLAGGVYHYEGNSNDSTFFATYRSDEDHGKFSMRRP